MNCEFRAFRRWFVPRRGVGDVISDVLFIDPDGAYDPDDEGSMRSMLEAWVDNLFGDHWEGRSGYEEIPIDGVESLVSLMNKIEAIEEEIESLRKRSESFGDLLSRGFSPDSVVAANFIKGPLVTGVIRQVFSERWDSVMESARKRSSGPDMKHVSFEVEILRTPTGYGARVIEGTGEWGDDGEMRWDFPVPEDDSMGSFREEKEALRAIIDDISSRDRPSEGWTMELMKNE